MRYLVISFIVLSCSTINLKMKRDKSKMTFTKTSSIPIPSNSTPYGVNMCKGKDFIPAYAFVLKGSEFDKKGCVKPIEAYVFDSEISRWVYMDSNLVKCCNPLKGYQKLTY